MADLRSWMRDKGSKDRGSDDPSILSSVSRPFAALFQQLGDDGGPSRLMAGSEALARVGVEILVEENQIAPVRVRLEARVGSIDRPAAIAAQEDRGQPPRQLGRDLP